MCTAEVEKMIEAAVPRSKVLIGQATAPGGLLYRDIFEVFVQIPAYGISRHELLGEQLRAGGAILDDAIERLAKKALYIGVRIPSLSGRSLNMAEGVYVRPDVLGNGYVARKQGVNWAIRGRTEEEARTLFEKELALDGVE